MTDTVSFDDIKAQHAAKHPTWADARAKRLKERRYPYCPLEVESLWQRIRRLPYAVKNWYWHKPIHRLTWKRERMQKGWSEWDWWSIDRHFAKMIAEVARKYRDDGHGYPMQYDSDGKELWEGAAVKKWNTILTEMADGFQGYYDEKLEFDDPAVKRAMALFAEWFPAMWD